MWNNILRNYWSKDLNPNQVFTRVDDHHEEGESNDEEPEVDEEVISAPLNDLDDGRDQRKSYNLHQNELLDLKSKEKYSSTSYR